MVKCLLGKRNIFDSINTKDFKNCNNWFLGGTLYKRDGVKGILCPKKSNNVCFYKSKKSVISMQCTKIVSQIKDIVLIVIKKDRNIQTIQNC